MASPRPTPPIPVTPIPRAAAQARASKLVHQLPVAFKNYRDERLKLLEVEKLRPHGAAQKLKEEKAVSDDLQKVEVHVEELEAECERLLLLCQQLSLTRQERAIREQIDSEKAEAKENAQKAAAHQLQKPATTTRIEITRMQPEPVSDAPHAPQLTKQPSRLRRAVSGVSEQFAEARPLS